MSQGRQRSKTLGFKQLDVKRLVNLVEIARDHLNQFVPVYWFRGVVVTSRIQTFGVVSTHRMRGQCSDFALVAFRSQ